MLAAAARHSPRVFYPKRRNEQEAVRWFLKAAERNHPPAQANLASMYEHGRGVRKNPTEARRWYQRAAALGDEPAKKWLEANPR